MTETTPDLEFASKEWVDAAREILQRAVREHAEELRGLSFSVCEVFTEAPARLGWPDQQLAWHLRIDDAEAEVGIGELEGADISMGGPYHVVLPIARTVYGGDPVRSMRARREAAHRAGLPAAAPTSEETPTPTAPPPAVSKVFSALHDGLARRTTDDPDLAGRTAAYGLTDAAKQVATDGWTLVSSAVSTDFARELASATSLSDPLVSELAAHPWITTLAEHALGAPAGSTGTTTGSVVAVLLLEESSAGPAGSLVIGRDVAAHVPSGVPALTLGFDAIP
jgi:hypothetical protein